MKGSLAQLLSDLPVYKSPQKRHHFEFLNKYEKPQAFLFRQDRSGSIKVVEYKSHLDRTMTPMTQIKLPSFQNRKNVSRSIHELMNHDESRPRLVPFRIRHRSQIDHGVVYQSLKIQ